MKWYEPAQTFVQFENGNYYDNNHHVLVDPINYNFDNGFYQLNE